MARRIDIPYVADLFIVNDARLLRTLNDHPLVSRRLVRSDRWINEMVRRRIQHHLKVGNVLLPTFRAREDAERAARQRDLQSRMDALATQGLAAHSDDIETLSDYVAGGPGIDVGVVVQRLVGRLFWPDYNATNTSYRASRTVDEWPRANVIEALWLTWSGRLAHSISQVWSLGRSDTHCIHATAIAMHNIVATLGEMRTGFAQGAGARSRTSASAVEAYLHGPATLVRSAVGPVDVEGHPQRLRAGTLIIFQLGKILEHTRDPRHAFAVGEWNECPATGVVHTLLTRVWDGAQRIGSET